MTQKVGYSVVHIFAELSLCINSNKNSNVNKSGLLELLQTYLLKRGTYGGSNIQYSSQFANHAICDAMAIAT
ncbi:hypothetical protein [Chroogloeocystis siderophila]|uniref:hypothetical protein n=1 Tax=Chroogloeocystis siderophila TaxID=329163 RepID=UPI0011612D0B|nr:hypothetical protein [Chroogloeocystis siderophila]